MTSYVTNYIDVLNFTLRFIVILHFYNFLLCIIITEMDVLNLFHMGANRIDCIRKEYKFPDN